MLNADVKLISVDDHVVEHPNVWQDRLPSKFKDVGPRIVETSERGQSIASMIGTTRERPASTEAWLYEGRVYHNIALGANVGRPPEEYGVDPVRFDEMRPGCYDPKARVADMDIDGVQAHLCFPTFPRFAGTTFLDAEDRDLALLCVQAYNDFILEEWCAAAPDRLIPMVILPLWDPRLAQAEIERSAAKGAKAISFVENPAPLGLPSFHTDHWEPVWSAAEEAHLPVCMHFGTSGRPPRTADDAPIAVTKALFASNSMWTTVDLLFSKVFHRHPGIKVAMSEGGIGWIPYMLESVDITWERHRFYSDINLAMRPSELFEQHIWGCFIEDQVGLRDRDLIGVNKILWESDYPHSDSLWPNSRSQAEKALAEVPDDEARMIAETNARQLFNFTADL